MKDVTGKVFRKTIFPAAKYPQIPHNPSHWTYWLYWEYFAPCSKIELSLFTERGIHVQLSSQSQNSWWLQGIFWPAFGVFFSSFFSLLGAFWVCTLKKLITLFKTFQYRLYHVVAFYNFYLNCLNGLEILIKVTQKKVTGLKWMRNGHSWRQKNDRSIKSCPLLTSCELQQCCPLCPACIRTQTLVQRVFLCGCNR